MNNKKILNRNNVLDNQFHIERRLKDSDMSSNNVHNCKSVSHLNSMRKSLWLDKIEIYLRKYFTHHMSIIRQHCQMNDFIDKHAFKHILRK